LHIINTRTGR